MLIGAEEYSELFQLKGYQLLCFCCHILIPNMFISLVLHDVICNYLLILLSNTVVLHHIDGPFWCELRTGILLIMNMALFIYTETDKYGGTA